MAATVGVVAGAGNGGDGPPRSEPAREERTLPPTRGLPLERQVGSLLLMSYDGPEVPEYILRRLREGQGAGVILFGPNAPDAETVRESTSQVQRAGGGAALVATDQEGGDIRSLAFAPPESSQAGLSSPDAAASAARDGARALRDAGVNVNLGPVADVAETPDSVVAGRAFPGDTEEVAGLVVTSVKAHARERVAATIKHFPGLGGATENTDDVSVTVDAPRDELERGALNAFRAGVSGGAPLVMASHALYPALDGEAIASQSRPVLEDLLRGELQFDGAVVTDSIEAQAVLDRSDVATAAERSVAAGVDLVLMTGSGSWNLIYPRLLRRARRDAAFRKRVTESADRVLALKRRLGLTVSP